MKRLESEAIKVRCACGWEITGPEDEVVAAVQEHGRRVHNMAATREEILAMAVDDRQSGADQADELQIVDAPEAGRYEAQLDGRVVGVSEYRRAGDRVVFLHTEVDPELEGRGVGSRLAAGALDDVRSKGLRVTPRCPFIASFIRRHPEYADLVVS
jgi:predicted GNAT family acetyltransferase